MKPQHFADANHTAGDIPVNVYDDGEQTFILSQWRLDFLERLAVLFGRPVTMVVKGDCHPVVALFVVPFRAVELVDGNGHNHD